MIRRTLILAALTVALAAPSVASAQRIPRGAGQQGQPQSQPQQRQFQPPAPPPERVRTISLSTAISIIERRVPGRLLNAGEGTMDGRPVISIRWGTEDGRRIDFVLDAVSGQILRGG